ncbi:MAG: hypothetical protein AB7P21_07140 [Lautropia sp.]
MPRMPVSNGYTPGFATIQAPTGGIPGSIGGPSAAGALARGAEQIGNLAVDFRDTRDRANQQRDDLAAQQAETAARERQQAIDAQLREDAAEKKRIGRLQAANASTLFELDANQKTESLREQLATGALSKDQFLDQQKHELDKLQGEYRAKLDPAFHMDFDLATVKPQRAAMLAGFRVLKDHQRDEVKAEISKSTEGLMRMSMHNLDRGLNYAELLFAPDGDVAKTLGVDEAQKQGQAFREQATHAYFQKQVVDQRSNPRALSALEKAISANGDLDPKQQTGLIASIESRRSVLENQAIAAQARRERAQESAFKELQTLTEQGFPIKPGVIERTLSTLKGSPMEGAAADLIKGSVDTVRITGKPLAEQERILQELHAQARREGVDKAELARIGRLTQAVKSTAAAYRDDPLLAANQHGQIDAIAPLKLDSLQDLGASLSERMSQLPIVEAITGRRISPLRPAEAASLADMLPKLPIPDQVAMIGAMREAIGNERMLAVSSQLKSKNDALGIVAAYEAEGRKTKDGMHLGELYLRGAQAIKDGTFKVDERALVGQRAELAAKIGDAFTTPAAKDAAIDATLKTLAGLNASGKSTSPDEALRIATGGIGELNGSKFPLPYGWTEGEVKRSIASVDPQHLVGEARGPGQLSIAGEKVSEEDLAKQLPRAQLRSAGQDQYAVLIGGKMVMNNGVPFRMRLPDPPVDGGAFNLGEWFRVR